MPDSSLPRTAFLRGAIAVMPLSLATAPWGLLAGSMAIEANLTPLQGQGLSSIVFAGAAQLVAIGMLKGGAGIFSILLTTLLLTSQHLLYGMSLRPVVSPLPGRWRVGLGFLLTDELFALTSQQQFNRWYALGVGLTFYVAWNLFTLAGIVLGSSIPGLEHLGLDFSIAATFIALITPVVRNVPTVVCVAVSLFCSVLFSYWQVGSGLVLAGLLGMTAGFVCNKFYGART
ncbi:Predicted branched-chain amino acid permease (azaleucine resistance) [Pseudomonas sp. ok272]|uniref:AzlC family ABC transporter permease n=1 Tax=unclassified Pseudomonas TaxID=196821 RepID=UPI0008D6BCCB|nr:MULTISPECIES: AzlC family ABC transporter permease [unclassified Pseudomonas]SEN56231.1 Predicted branched-chain amino acid permease (azaleucine resistance) [Pseudomonas sp. ok272]SFN44303.1 Predicted branched-chain amino acid permease (azaleucine resistance) [Pseudomonas sp. ok602]